MATKSWTATDLKMGRIELERCIVIEADVEYNGLRVTRYYQFIDAAGDLLPMSAGGITIEKKMTDVPTDILSALGEIDTYTTNAAKTKEGL